MLIPFVIDSVSKHQQLYSIIVKKYDYLQMNEFFCRVPKNNSIYINDIKLLTKYSTFIEKWMLLYFLMMFILK